MSQLRLVGVSEDGSALLLSDSHDGTFTLPLDEDVASAVRRRHSSTARLENDMDGAMRPRDIQARIRAGASVDDVVAESGLPHERVERFADPMLAERDHVATLARGTEVRRDFAADLDLGAAVAERLEPLGVERGATTWDAWRREDGRWVVEAAYALGREQRSGHWLFDPKASSLSADDDEGRWLIDPQAPEPVGSERGKPRLATVRTLTSVVEVTEVDVVEIDDVEIDDDSALDAILQEGTDDVIDIEPVDDDFAAESLEALTVLDAQSHSSVAAMAEDVEEQLSLVDAPAGSSPNTADEAPAAHQTAPRRAPKRKGRASVPAWDDIVFGSRKATD